LNIEDRVVIVPWQKRDKIPDYLLSFDALVLPGRVKNREGDSPIKMFEYLPAKRPIITASVPAILEVMKDNSNALIVKSNNPQDWASAIEKVAEDDRLRGKISEQAFQDAKHYSWQKRAEDISKFLLAGS